MKINLAEFGNLLRAFREARQLTQKEVSDAVKYSLTARNLSNIESGKNYPTTQQTIGLCDFLKIPISLVNDFLSEDFEEKINFENSISELYGEHVTMQHHDHSSIQVVNLNIKKLNNEELTPNQQLDTFNSILGFYGVKPISRKFFSHYFANGINSREKFEKGVEKFQIDAIRLHSNLNDAYLEMCDHINLENFLLALQPKNPDNYKKRSPWAIPNKIPEEELSNLGYISAEKIKETATLRKELKEFLLRFSKDLKSKDVQNILSSINEKEKSKMDQLMREFDVRIEHGLYSSLFTPSINEIEREANRLQPEDTDSLATIKETQRKALINLSAYLLSDHLDVYVATSMRSDADFYSANSFVEKVFNDDLIREYKLRYFNPTQSWIEERIAKGLVEALMLKRSMATIYMAQKTDTFGKDSEASVALGQGKPVIVYVPKLQYEDVIDSEELYKKNTNDLANIIKEKEIINDIKDHQNIFAKALEQKLRELDDFEIISLAKIHLSDFDLFSETHRIETKTDNKNQREDFENWLNKLQKSDIDNISINSSIRTNLINIIIATTINFEKRANLFKEIHPLALQVVISSGVLNGMLVVRSAKQCAITLDNIVKNNFDTYLEKDEFNIKLIEKNTKSTIRVVSKHTLIKNSFKKHFYG